MNLGNVGLHDRKWRIRWGRHRLWSEVILDCHFLSRLKLMGNIMKTITKIVPMRLWEMEGYQERQEENGWKVMGYSFFINGKPTVVELYKRLGSA